MSTKAERAAAVADVRWAIGVADAELSKHLRDGQPAEEVLAMIAEAGRTAQMLLSRLPPPCLRSDEP